MSKAVRDVQDSVREESLAEPLARHAVFPAMVVQLLAVGEETGALDTMLTELADFYDQEVKAAVEALPSLIEPILIAVMGGGRLDGGRPVHADVQDHQPDQVVPPGRCRGPPVGDEMVSEPCGLPRQG
jgi:Type II secretion system (T2SS), protein F